jgi:hypothetical protein
MRMSVRWFAGDSPFVRLYRDQCGSVLPWSDDRIRLFDNRWPVRTASTLQVRRPAYKTSVGRWQPNGAMLARLPASAKHAMIFAVWSAVRRRGGREMKPFAPVLKYQGGRGELERLLRLAVSPVVDIRDPIQRARARIAARAELVDAQIW